MSCRARDQLVSAQTTPLSCSAAQRLASGQVPEELVVREEGDACIAQRAWDWLRQQTLSQ